MQFFQTKWPAILLWPFSFLFGIVIRFRNFLYDVQILKSTHISCPVISIGNITVGGTGKTPTVLFLAKWLTEKYKVCIISRGYRRNSTGHLVVSDGETISSTVQEAGDEPFLLAKRLPNTIVIVNSNRVEAALRAYQDFHPDVILLDDAMQHRKIFRDMEIVTMQGDNFFGNKFMLPAGPLREQLSGLKRADLIWINNSKNNLKTFKNKPVINAHYQPEGLGDYAGTVFKISDLKTKIIAVCGLGSPDNFKKTLEQYGAYITKFLTFKDHHEYTLTDIQNIEKQFKQNNAKLLVTTEKDWVKIAHLVSLKNNWRYLIINAQPDDLEKIAELIESVLS